ncbi:hypothetical protein OG225_31495 [Nocardia sp. NBC_01377]|uniref:hypothetical protein n=1 Tax=Nocardia TaxID=1817 RepID=UPI001C21F4C6|nr:hypothetical protein [Nocardia noduli]
MKLRSFLHRRHADQVPLLPSLDVDQTISGGGSTPRRAKRQAREEGLERLLTPGELDLVQRHRV